MANEIKLQRLIDLNILEMEIGNKSDLSSVSVELFELVHNDIFESAGKDEQLVYTFHSSHNAIFEKDKETAENFLKWLGEYNNLIILYTFKFKHFKEVKESLGKNIKHSAKIIVNFKNFLYLIENDIATESSKKGVHASLLSMYDEGVMIKGEAGIGKSELCVSLVKRGHLIVSDDAVDLNYESGRVIGRPSGVISKFIEIRGIGAINLKRVFGLEKISYSHHIDYIVELKHYDKIESNSNRLNIVPDHEEIFGVEIPKLKIYLSPGKSAADIIEIAIINEKYKKYDNYNGTEHLLRKLKDK